MKKVKDFRNPKENMSNWFFDKYGKMEDEQLLDRCNYELRNGGPGKDWISYEYNISLRKEKLKRINDTQLQNEFDEIANRNKARIGEKRRELENQIQYKILTNEEIPPSLVSWLKANPDEPMCINTGQDEDYDYVMINPKWFRSLRKEKLKRIYEIKEN